MMGTELWKSKLIKKTTFDKINRGCEQNSLLFFTLRSNYISKSCIFKGSNMSI